MRSSLRGVLALLVVGMLLAFSPLGAGAAPRSKAGAPKPTQLSITFAPDSLTFTVTGAHLRSGTPVLLDVDYHSRPPVSGLQIATVTRKGTVTARLFYLCDSVMTVTAHGTAKNGAPITSPVVTAPC